MSRNSSGVYTLPLPAFQAGTVIKSADMNTDLSDIASALTQSLATNGVSSMTGPLKLAAGTLSAPSLTQAADTTTGFYSSNTGEWTFVSAGVAVMTIGSAISIGVATTFTNNVVFSGSVSFTGDFSVGNLAAQTVSITASGTTPSAPAANTLKVYFRSNVQYGPGVFVDKLYGIDSSSNIMPMLFVGGQCYLSYDSSGFYSGKLVLRPFGGNMLTIAGRPRQIFQYGGQYPSLAASNTANTFVYIYAYANSNNTVSLELSTTAPDYTSDTGVPIKTSDGTRTLVGAAYTDTGGAWADSAGKMWVLSYFNRKPKRSKYTSSTSLGTYVAATVTVSQEFTASFRNQFITWDDEIIRLSMEATWNTSTVSGASYVYPRIDNGADSNTLSDTGPLTLTIAATNTFANIYTVASGVSAGAVHYFSPTYISSANNINVICTQTVSATSTNTFYTVVEVRG